MSLLCLWLVFSQLPESIVMPKGIVEHSGLDNIESQMPADVYDERMRILRWVAERNYDEVAAELSRRYKQTEKNRAAQLVTMTCLLGAVSEGRFADPVTKIQVNGGTDSKFRQICRPYVDAVVLPDVAIPAAPAVLDAQIRMVRVFQANTDESDRAKVGEQPELRKEYVRRLCLVWSRLVETSLLYRETFTEDILKGRASYPRPEPPDFLFEFANGRTDPKRISDPVKRKAYEEYIAAETRQCSVWCRQVHLHPSRAAFARHSAQLGVHVWRGSFQVGRTQANRE